MTAYAPRSAIRMWCQSIRHIGYVRQKFRFCKEFRFFDAGTARPLRKTLKTPERRRKSFLKAGIIDVDCSPTGHRSRLSPMILDGVDLAEKRFLKYVRLVGHATIAPADPWEQQGLATVFG